MNLMKIALPVLGVALALMAVTGCENPKLIVTVGITNTTNEPVHIFGADEKFDPKNKVDPSGFRKLRFADEQEDNETYAEVTVRLFAGQNGVIGGSYEETIQEVFLTSLGDASVPTEYRFITLCLSGSPGRYQFSPGCFNHDVANPRK